MTTAASSSILAIQPVSKAPMQPPPTLTALNRHFFSAPLTIRQWHQRGHRRQRPLSEAIASVPQILSHLYVQDAIDPQQLEALSKETLQGAFRRRLSLACRIAKKPPLEHAVYPAGNTIVEIRWLLGSALPDLSFFKRFSKTGVWNHLVIEKKSLLADSMAASARHPNIVHSWEAADSGDSQNAYGVVRPLPGRPLWQVVKDPVQRFLLVDRIGKERLLRLRLDADGERIYTTGEALEYRFLRPDRLPQGYLDEICAMVAAGGTVAATHVRSNLERAYLIGVTTENGVIVGNSSLKNPRPAYIESVARRSGLDLTGFLERGYTSVRPEYRGLGIGTRLLEGLTKRCQGCKIYSVISEDNEATKIIALRNRTRKVATYFSPNAGKPVGIWMPEGTVAPRTGTPAP